MKRGLALGCGGTLGAAWSVGVLATLAEREGWDAREADAIIGTSAGAEYGAMLAAGVAVEDMVAAQRGSQDAPAWLLEHLDAAPAVVPPIPFPWPIAPRLLLRRGLPRITRLSGAMPIGRDSHARMLRLGERLADASGWVPHEAFMAVAVDLGTGRRVAFGVEGARSADLPQALAASWAVPGCFPPVRIKDGRYIDGGAASAASVDLLAERVPELDEIIVIAPMASSPVPRPPNRAMAIEARIRRRLTTGLDAECARAEAKGIRVRRFEMSAESLRAAGPNFNDARRRRRVLEQSLSEHASTASVAG